MVTRDNRFIKILEVLPVNIYLKSPNDRQNIILQIFSVRSIITMLAHLAVNLLIYGIACIQSALFIHIIGVRLHPNDFLDQLVIGG